MKTRFKKIIAGAISAVMVMSSFAVFAANDGVLPKDEVIQSAEAAEPETTASPETPDMSVWDIPTTFGLDSEAAEPMALSADVTASGKCGDNLTWTLDSNGTLTISGTGDMSNYKYNYAAPWYNYAESLKTLVLNSGITSIGDYAFNGCSGLTGNLIIPDGVTRIGDTAFKNCSGLTGVEIPDSVTRISYFAFFGCSGLTGNLIIPDGVTRIDDAAFKNCSNLTGNLIIPDGVTRIGIQTFEGCSSLTGLKIPDGVTVIDNMAFSLCSGLTGSLVIPGSVTSIGDNAFLGCSGLTGNLVIPDSVTSIGSSAFKGCGGLTGNLVIPDSVTQIGAAAFRECTGFTGELVIPDSVTSINNFVFDGCSGLTGSLVIPDSVTSIGNGTFESCYGLNGSLIIPDSVTSIAQYAFFNCHGLTGSLIIPDNVTQISTFAFAHCSGLTGNLVIPESVTVIDTAAFRGCRGINDMYIPQNEDSIGIGDFPNRVHWKYDLSKCTATIKDYTCTGEAIIPTEDSITVTSPSGKTLYYGTDYVITGANNNTNVGTATAHIAPPEGGISIMSQNVPFNIVGIDISGAAVTFPEDITYQGEPCCPEPTVVVNGMTLTKGTDYTVEYSDNNAVGTGKAKITGIGNYVGSVNAEFEIEEFDPNKGDRIDVPIDDDTLVEGSIQGTFVYNGTEHTPKPKLVYHFTNPTTGITLDYDMIEGKDYEIVSFVNNTNVGIGRVNIKGIGTFISNTSVNFIISPCELSATTIADIPSAEYCKKDICPNPEIKIGDKVMVKDVDYELSYENNRNRGTATVTITGKGNLSGAITKTFEITPRDGTKFTIVIWL